MYVKSNECSLIHSCVLFTEHIGSLIRESNTSLDFLRSNFDFLRLADSAEAHKLSYLINLVCAFE